MDGNMPLAAADPEVFDLVEREKYRQWQGLELIASEVASRNIPVDADHAPHRISHLVP